LRCEHIKGLVEAEVRVIRKHVNRAGENDDPATEAAIIRFVEQYVWLIREMYCGYVCPKREGCELANGYRPEDDGAKLGE